MLRGRRFFVPIFIVFAVVASLCSVPVSRAAAATGVILDSGSPVAIADSYIVGVQASAISGSTTVASLAQSLTTEYGGTATDVEAGLDTFEMTGTDAIAEAIAGDSRVAWVDQNEVVAPASVQDDPDWGLDRIDQRQLPLDGTYTYPASAGAGTTIYVVDSGVDTTDPDFGTRASAGYDATTGTAGVAPDCTHEAHGTHVAGIAAGDRYGVAKQAKIVAVKVFKCDTNGDPEYDSMVDVNKGLNWILANGTAPAVVNLSLGDEGHDAAFAQAVDDLQGADFTVVLAAGNDDTEAADELPGSQTPSSAAMSPIVVGATTSSDFRAPFSNYGSALTLFAPGMNIASDDGGSGAAASAVMSGTSMATPFVSGAAALLLAANHSMAPAAVKTALVNNATSPATSGGPVVGNPEDDSPDLLLYTPAPNPQVPLTINGPAVSQAVGSGVADVDYTFSGTAGQTVYVNGSAGAFNAAIGLYDDNGTELANGSHPSNEANKPEDWITPVTLSTTGTYSIHITPDPGSSGSVSAQVLTFATKSATVNGAPVSVTIPSSLPGQRTEVTFAGTQGQSLYINGIAGHFNVSLHLEDPTGALIGSGTGASQSGTSTTSWIAPVPLPSTGTYTLYITPDPGSSGTFSFQVLGGVITVAPTVNGPVVSATVSTAVPGQMIQATFTGTVGQTIYINGTTPNFGASMQLKDTTGQQIANGSELKSSTTMNWIAPVNLPSTGTYTLDITPSAGLSGTTSFQVLGGVIAVAPTVNGPVVSATVSSAVPGQMIQATFTGTIGQTIYINGTTPNFGASIQLLDPTGQRIANDTQLKSSTTQNWITPVTLPSTGTYTLDITPSAGLSGTTSFQVLGGVIAVAPTVNGPVVSAAVSSALPGQMIQATFTGTVGQTIYINGTTPNFGASIQLLDPTGQRIANDIQLTSSATLSWIAPMTLPSTGTYTLDITPNPGGSGTIGFQVLSGAITVTPTIDGAAVSATVSSALPGQLVLATFSGSAGQSVYVNGTSADFGVSLQLKNPSGQVIATDIEFASLLATNWVAPVTLPSTGTYTLVITPDPGSSGPISFQVLGSYVTASASVNGLPVELTIPVSAPGKIMSLTFSATAGTALSVLGITGAVGGTLSLVDPDGVQIATGIAIPLYPCPEDEDPGTCPQVLILPVTGQVTGQYTLYFTPAAFDVGPVSLWVTGIGGTATPIDTISASMTVDGAGVPVTIPSGASGERVAVSFTATAGQSVYINTANGDFSLNSASISLVGPNGPVPIPSTSTALYGSSTLESPIGALSAGTYTLYLLPSANSSGTFTIQALSTYVTGSFTVDGATTTVTIPSTSPSKRVALTFTATAGQSVYLNLTNGSFDLNGASISLVGPNGPVLIPSTSGVMYGSTNLESPIGLAAAGTYTLYLVPSANSYGAFTIQALSTYVTSSFTVDGATTTVTIPSTSPSKRVALTFTATADQSVYLNTTNGSDDLNGATISLVGPNGPVLIPSPSGVLYGATNLESPIGLATAGTYTLYLVPSANSYGAFTIQALSTYVTGTLTVDGATTTVTIPSTSPSKRVALTFTATAGQAVYLNLTNGSNDLILASISLVGPNGPVLIPSTSGVLYGSTNLESPIGLTTAGTYTLYLVPSASSYGAFTIQALSTYVTGTLTVDGATKTVTIPSTSPSKRVALTFTATAGQSVYLNLTNGSNDLILASISLVGPNGPVLIPSTSGVMFGSTNLESPIGLTTAGTYTLYLVPSANSYGAFAIQALSAYVTAPLTVGGAAVPVTIPSTSPSQRVVLTFTAANAGEAVSLAYSGASGLDQVSESLVGPSGLLVSSPANGALYGTGNLLNPIGLPEAGTYQLYLIPSAGSTGTLTATLSAYGYGQPWPSAGPGAPPWVNGHPLTDTSILLNWGAATDYSNPPSPIVSYTVTFGPYTETVSGTTATITDLIPGDQYTFTVTATDQDGVTGPPSSAIWLGTLSYGPGVPTNLAGTSPSSSSIVLTWTAAADYSTPPSPIVGYEVYVGSSKLASVSGTTLTVTGLSASTTYTFTVVAIDADGEDGPPSEPASVTTQS